MDYSKKLAKRTLGMQTSAIRKILKVANQQGVISMAGGLPAPETFPTDIIKRLSHKVIDEIGPSIFQYGVTEGNLELRKQLSVYLRQKEIKISPDDVNISTGAQGAIDAAAKVIIDPGDFVAVESPTFLAAIKTFKTYQPKLVEIPTDDKGIIPDEIEKIVRKNKVKLLYLIPNFQNPTGYTLSLDRRKKIALIVKKHKVLTIEDDPYYELRYSGKDIRPIYTLAPDNVIYIGTFSKILSPGMRLGYYVAKSPLRKLMTSVRQGVDVHANSFAQAIAAEYLRGGHLESHLPKIVSIYKTRLEVMLDSLERYFPRIFNWSRPEGGMYVWVKGSKSFDAKAIYQKAIKRGVAFVPGEFFFVDQSKGKNTMRLNFTNVNENDNKKGIRILGSLLSELPAGITSANTT